MILVLKNCTVCPIRMFVKLLLTLLAFAGLAVFSALACGGRSSPSNMATDVPKVRVVTTIALLADFARNVGEERVDVESIVPPGADVHSFQPTPGDSIAISQARVIISNGFGLDSFLDSLLSNVKTSRAVHVVAAEGLQPSPIGKAAVEGDTYGGMDGDEHNQAGADPHFWQNPLYAAHYVERIRDGLIAADPAGAAVYRDNAASYIQRLLELDREIVSTLNSVPPSRRHLVTFHDAFGYLVQRYGWERSAFVPSDASDVTPKAAVAVLRRVKDEGIPLVFAEPQFSGDVLHQTAKDAGIGVGLIYSGVLDANPSTYIEMMRFNAKSLLRLQH